MLLHLQVCAACLSEGDAPDIENLRTAVLSSDLSERVTVEAVSCDDECAVPARLWLQTDGGASYVFEGIDLDRDREDILATIGAYLASPKGWIEDARPCGRLRFCLTARLPA